MDAVGVVCEFDPLHRGHEALLRRAGASGRPVVCAMSGNFTQRGGPACAEKFVRAEMAVRCGADLVAELPTPWAMATAEKFADGGVALLAKCGVTKLYFGSECSHGTAENVFYCFSKYMHFFLCFLRENQLLLCHLDNGIYDIRCMVRNTLKIGQAVQ